MDKILQAFVIMPFDSEFDSIYAHLIKPSLEDAGYEVTRADSLTDQQNILRDIVEGIANADIIVADLSTVNANVFYELGLCHGLRIPTILLSQSMDDVPFDLRSYRVQIYETRFDKIHKLKDSLREIASKHKSGSVAFGSPVIDFYPKELKTKAVASDTVVADVSEEELGQDTSEEEDDKGVLDYAADIEEAFEEMSRIVAYVGDLNAEYTEKLSEYTTRLQNLTTNPPPGAASKKRGIFMQAASDMNKWAKGLEQEVPSFEQSIETLDESFPELVNLVERSSKEEDKEGIANSLKIFSDFIPQVREAAISFRSLEETTAGLRGISKDVNRASRRLAQAIGAITQNIERVEAFAVRALGLLENMSDSGASTEGDAT